MKRHIRDDQREIEPYLKPYRRASTQSLAVVIALGIMVLTSGALGVIYWFQLRKP